MAVITVESIIENTTMTKYIDGEGVERTYRITPVSGYVLHDNRLDYPNYDDTEIILGYTGREVSVPITYDFTENMYELYTVLQTEVPADQIFGTTDKPVTE